MLADRAVPSISTPQLALVEPDFDTCRPKRVTNPPRRVSILRGVAQEHRSRRCAARRFRRLLPHPRLLVLFGAEEECPEEALTGNSDPRLSASTHRNGGSGQSHRAAQGREPPDQQLAQCGPQPVSRPRPMTFGKPVIRTVRWENESQIGPRCHLKVP